ncbi:MAG: L,D-transpeptidase family protein [Rhodospirillales bacterium]|nr:L,D-transpeptidase family protein [Rhodospirillales bacterium]
MDFLVTSQRLIRWDAREARCALGRTGIRSDKQEGDGATPAGRYPLRRILFRPDRIAMPQSGLPCQTIGAEDGWCDDPGDPAYNRLIRLPYPGRHERLWRDDHLYDLVIVVGYNDSPPCPGYGSAIFVHLATEDFAPTEGCIALGRPALLAMATRCQPGDCLRIDA